jgi:hypothetical protein
MIKTLIISNINKLALSLLPTRNQLFKKNWKLFFQLKLPDLYSLIRLQWTTGAKIVAKNMIFFISVPFLPKTGPLCSGSAQ